MRYVGLDVHKSQATFAFIKLAGSRKKLWTETVHGWLIGTDFAGGDLRRVCEPLWACDGQWAFVRSLPKRG